MRNCVAPLMAVMMKHSPSLGTSLVNALRFSWACVCVRLRCRRRSCASWDVVGSSWWTQAKMLFSPFVANQMSSVSSLLPALLAAGCFGWVHAVMLECLRLDCELVSRLYQTNCMTSFRHMLTCMGACNVCRLPHVAAPEHAPACQQLIHLYIRLHSFGVCLHRVHGNALC